MVFAQTSGAIPASLGRLGSLRVLRLTGNHLTGACSVIRRLCADGIRLLTMYSSGVIAHLVWGSRDVQTNNCFRGITTNCALWGSTPKCLTACRLVVYATDVRDDYLPTCSDISAFICRRQYSHRSVLDMFHGVPARWPCTTASKDGPSLGIEPHSDILRTSGTLIVSPSSLAGPIPPELGELKALKVLKLNGNELDGEQAAVHTFVYIAPRGGNPKFNPLDLAHLALCCLRAHF